MKRGGSKDIWLFSGLLLLAGTAYMFTRTGIAALDTLMFCANFMIYIALLISWIYSVRSRLLPTKARSYAEASALLMIAELLVRFLRFRVLTGIAVRRFADYAYNIPLILIPTLFLMTCIRIRRGEGGERRAAERLLLIPSGVLLLLILTNDLHQLFYRRLIPLSEFHGIVGTYTYGPLFYAMYGWMGIVLIAGLLILISRTWKQNIRGLSWFAAVLVFWGAVSLLNRLVLTPHETLRMFHAPEIHVFSLLGLFEVCIRNRLIPYNENYTGFFSRLGLPVLITDSSLKPVYATDVPVSASQEQLKESLESPVYIDGDTRLSGMSMLPGLVFWTEDERELHRESHRLAEANEILSEENGLIAVENELQVKKAHLDAQARVYDRISAALYPKQKRIEELLNSASPESDSFPAVLAECCVLNAYCKRKSNLMLLEEESLPRPNRELFLAMQETARFLKCRGIDAAATGVEYSDFPLARIHELYDSFEILIEALLPVMRRMTASLMPDGIRLTIEADPGAETGEALPGTPLPVERVLSDGCLFLTIRAKGGAG